MSTATISIAGQNFQCSDLTGINIIYIVSGSSGAKTTITLHCPNLPEQTQNILPQSYIIFK
jgi:hypothetical protein